MIVIRECEGHDELEACVELQVETWGYDATDTILRKAFLVMQKAGGQVIGRLTRSWLGRVRGTATRRRRRDGAKGVRSADAGSMVAFALSLPGVKTGASAPGGKPYPYIHSHMLAVKEGYRNRGLGAQLKLAQRSDALERGITHIEWTFDPVEIKNAFLNINKLGRLSRIAIAGISMVYPLLDCRAAFLRIV